MTKPKDQGNAFYLSVGCMAFVKTRKHKRLNYGQTVRVKGISGNIVTVIPDNDENPENWAVMSAGDLHNNEMSY